MGTVSKDYCLVFRNRPIYGEILKLLLNYPEVVMNFANPAFIEDGTFTYGAKTANILCLRKIFMATCSP